MLFHGTRYPHALLQSNPIRLPSSGYQMVSLTRDRRVATHWARLPRDDDEGIGAVLLLDRDKLRARYRISPFRDEAWHQGASRLDGDEAEEIVLGRQIDNLSKFLMGVLWLRTDHKMVWIPSQPGKE